MAHNDAYLDAMTFSIDGTPVNLPYHDGEALHDEDNVVKENHIEDGAVTEEKIADGAITEDKFSPDLKEAWDSQYQKFDELGDLKLSNGIESLKIRSYFDGLAFEFIDSDGKTSIFTAYSSGMNFIEVVNGVHQVVWSK